MQGIVLPERAKLDELNWSVTGTLLGDGKVYSASVSVICNQVAIWFESELEFSVLELKHLAEYVVGNQLFALSYIIGCVFDFQVTRVINRSKGVDYVYGIENSAIFGRKDIGDLNLYLERLRARQIGINGTLIHRCLSDLSSAMRYREDTAFYCYRAIESLKQHYCAEKNILSRDDKKAWELFREGNGFSEAQLKWFAQHAMNSRHGKVSVISSEDNDDLLRRTWDVVDTYLGI
jgi:hypothetical protein